MKGTVVEISHTSPFATMFGWPARMHHWVSTDCQEIFCAEVCKRAQGHTIRSEAHSPSSELMWHHLHVSLSPRRKLFVSSLPHPV